jgi:hypothetical protein
MADLNNDLFEGLDSSLGFLEQKKVSQDGIFRPKAEDAIDKKRGYKAVIRFLPNLEKETGKIGPAAIEKHLHYVQLPDRTDLNGYYDCGKNFEGGKCPICDTYWKLKNSKSVADQEKAELIKRSTKYYSYVLIVEDEQKPELVGKIMIFPFGFKIKEKLNQEKTGEITGVPCNVYDLGQGKDFTLIVKNVGGFANYDSSAFAGVTSSVKLKNKEGQLKEIPTVDNNGRKVVDPRFREKIQEFLVAREVDLNSYSPVVWDDDTRTKVETIVSILMNNPIAAARSSVSNAQTGNAASSAMGIENDFDTKSSSNDIDDFFNDL